MSLTQDIKDVIELLKRSDINGCITGSSMLDENFDTWDQAPDVDVFVYNEMQLLHASDMLMYKHGFELLSAGEEWKFDRVCNRGAQGNAALTTMKLINDKGVVVNITYKKWKNTMLSVLASFDMSVIMIGYDIPFGWGIDMRTKNVKIFDDKFNRWSNDPKVAKPNPMRKQDVDMYGTEMWVRQFDRVIKYWNRGIDTRLMARFYIDLIEGVIAKGQLFTSSKGEESFNGFVATYEPLRDKMVEWLKDKEDC